MSAHAAAPAASEITAATPPSPSSAEVKQYSSLRLTLEFLTDWAPSTGDGGAATDSQVVRDEDGLPYLPAKLFRGHLREALSFLDQTAPKEGCDVVKLLGTEGHMQQGTLRIGDARIAAADRPGAIALRPHLFAVIAQTAIDDATGAARVGSKREIEVAVPMVLELEITSLAPEGLSKDQKTRIEEALPLIRAIGHGKTRGLGWVEIKLKEAVPAANPSPSGEGQTASDSGTVSPAETSASSSTPGPQTSDGVFRLIYVLEALEPLIVSAHSATLGGHRSLRYIPGARLFGAVAGGLYLDDELRSAVLNGGLRFGDARLLIAELPPSANTATNAGGAIRTAAAHVTVPWPANLRHIGSKQAEELHDLTSGPAGEGTRTYGDAADAVTLARSDGGANSTASLLPIVRKHRVRSGFRLRTATENGTAKTGALFGFEHLSARQRFAGEVIFKGSAQAFARLCALIEQAAERFAIGRSRSAEYGRMRLRLIKEEANAEPCAPDACGGWLPQAGEALSLFLLSDLAVFDAYGAPLTVPKQANDLGLPDWLGDFLPEKSALSYRSYSPVNGYYKAPDDERTVIARGSVLSFKVMQGPTSEQMQALRQQLALGLGEYRAYGLGEAVIWQDEARAERYGMRVLDQAEASASSLQEGVQDGTAQESAWLQGLRESLERRGLLPTKTAQTATNPPEPAAA